MRLLPSLLLLAAIPLHAGEALPAMGWSTYNFFHRRAQRRVDA